MGFTTPSFDLDDLFTRIDRGDLQLPDFQRDFKWNIDAIRELLVTVLRGYPMGAFMVLATRNAPRRFASRPVAGAPVGQAEPGWLLLDGQQRLTTLYRTMQGDGFVDTVDSREKPIRRRFFVDIAGALGEDIMPDEAVFSVDEEGRVRSFFERKFDFPLTSTEAYIRAGVVPVADLLGEKAAEILLGYATHGDAEREAVQTFTSQVLAGVANYRVPIIRIDPQTAQAGVGSIFAHANYAGLPMDVFELLTAVFANEDPTFDLQADWARTEQQLREHRVFAAIGSTEFLMSVALLVTARKGVASGHREDILRLTLAEYIPAAEEMRAAFAEAFRFITVRGMYSAEQVPYAGQLISLAVILALLGETPDAARHTGSYDRLNRWFWSGVFGELYGSHSLITRMGHDCTEVSEWVRAAMNCNGVLEPATVRDATFAESRFFSLSRDSSAHKGIYTLLMARGARDWRTGEAFTEVNYEELDPGFHRVFPLQWGRANGVDPILLNSVLNLTPMGKRTEELRAGTAPSRYVLRVEGKSLLTSDEFRAVVASHLLDPDLLLSDDVYRFFQDRRERFVRMISEAMGKPVIRDVDDSDLGGGLEGPKAFRH
ncbi:MAG: DUF262 domain-containing protein [Corynebacterium sp.]|nr:DUF262 domain-containing protein [Corynebacterium sp.]